MCPPLLAALPAIGATAAPIAATAVPVAAQTATALTGMQQLMIASTALSTLGTVHGIREQKKAARENAEAANEAKNQEDQQINISQANQQQDAAEQKIRNNQEAQKAAARAAVAQGESGGSLNNNAVLQDIGAQGLTGNNQVSTNLDRLEVDSKYQKIAAKNRAQSRINSVAMPSNFAAGLQIGSDITSGASDYYATFDD